MTARRLTSRNPTQADLSRAVSTAYYAVFHTLARQCADLLAGPVRRGDRTAWAQVYRSLEHGFAKKACLTASAPDFVPDVIAFASVFAHLQERRHEADYDPVARVAVEEASELIIQAEEAIESFAGAPRAARRAFAIHVLLKKRG